jgi:hypothetical protein
MHPVLSRRDAARENGVHGKGSEMDEEGRTISG